MQASFPVGLEDVPVIRAGQHALQIEGIALGFLPMQEGGVIRVEHCLLQGSKEWSLPVAFPRDHDIVNDGKQNNPDVTLHVTTAMLPVKSWNSFLVSSP